MNLDFENATLACNKETLLIVSRTYCRLANADSTVFNTMTQSDFNDFSQGADETSGVLVNGFMHWRRFVVSYKPLLMWLIGKTGTSRKHDQFYNFFVHLVTRQKNEKIDDIESVNFFLSIVDDYFALS